MSTRTVSVSSARTAHHQQQNYYNNHNQDNNHHQQQRNNHKASLLNENQPFSNGKGYRLGGGESNNKRKESQRKSSLDEETHQFSRSTDMSHHKKRHGNNSSSRGGGGGGVIQKERVTEKSSHYQQQQQTNSRSVLTEVPGPLIRSVDKPNNQKEMSEKKTTGQLKTGNNLNENGEKIPIRELFKRNGANYDQLRKQCKMSNEETCESGPRGNKQIVTYDCFQIPDGYTIDDLPDPDSQELNQSVEELPISPAVRLAEADRQRRERKVSSSNSPDVEKLLSKLQKNRKKRTEPATAPNPEPEPVVNDAASTSIINGSFPDDSMNDFELIIATQQAESEFANTALTNQNSINDMRKRDANGYNKSESAVNVPLTSTPNPGNAQKHCDEKETPRARRVSGAGSMRVRNASNQQISVGEATFENSVVELSPISSEAEYKECEDELPRKALKFSESPIKPLGSNKNDDMKFGDFTDDGEDEIFSQLPEEIFVGASENNKNTEPNCDKTTILLTNADSSNINNDVDEMEMESYMNESELEAIAQLEAMNCRSASTSANSSSSSVPNSSFSNRRSPRNLKIVTSSSPKSKETPRRLKMGLRRSSRKIQ